MRSRLSFNHSLLFDSLNMHYDLAALDFNLNKQCLSEVVMTPNSRSLRFSSGRHFAVSRDRIDRRGRTEANLLRR